MNLKQFRYVLVLADQKSFSRAAEELNISQPSLSQYVRKIEKELGVTLFDRSGSILRLTDAGKAYIEAGRAILDIEQRMKGKFADLDDCKSGTIVIGISPHRSVCLLPRAVARFREKYPGMQIIIDERVSSELLDKAEHGEYDLCVTTLPVDETVFKYEAMRQDKCILAVPAGSKLDKKLEKSEDNSGKDGGGEYPAIDVRCINGSDFVVLSENQLMQRILEDICREYKIDINKIVICKSLESELALVREGIGAALLPSGMLNESSDKVHCYSFIQEFPVREIVAIYRKEYEITKAVRDFIEILKNV